MGRPWAVNGRFVTLRWFGQHRGRQHRGQTETFYYRVLSARLRVYIQTMPRPPRIDFPDALYHVTSRGNGRATIFHDEADCERFLAQLATISALPTSNSSPMF